MMMTTMMDLAVAVLRLLPAEAAHTLTVELSGAFAPLVPRARPDDPRLRVKALGLEFSNPVGMAAGFDKNATAYGAMFRLGFGHVEVGTLTPRPQSGNPKPRMFRLPADGAIINRMGFNNRGMDWAAARLAKRRKGGGILGINIGANKDSADRVADYRLAYAKLAPLADYVAINVSSPNTPGLRKLQGREELHRLLFSLAETRATTKKPLLLKIAPDLDAAGMDDIAAEVLAARIDGMIVTNTTLSRTGLKGGHAGEEGGLSGKPLFVPSNQVLAGMRARLGEKSTLIGVGGISSGEEAYAKIRAGASLVQVYTALVFQGIGLLDRIKRDLLHHLVRDGFPSVGDAVGVDAGAAPRI
jgi:dihydroorotate dehydrogenase